MPRVSIHQCKTEYLQIMDENGKVDEHLLPKLPKETILKMYRTMVLARRFDEKLLALQRQGKIGTFAQVKGQEAQVAAMVPLTKDDWVVPSFRELAAMLYRGMPPRNSILVWGGDERGNFDPNSPRDLPMAIPVGSQTLHAVGLAWASKLKNKKDVAVCFFGDGATSEGDFHEALNFASVFKIPCIFVCQNNQFAISLPRKKQTASQTLAQKACAYDIPGIQVDGNDVFALYTATNEAVVRARKGDGPTLIEMYTYRLADHTTSDDASKYRTEKEVEEWAKKDPIKRLRKYIIKNGMWNDKNEEQMLKDIEKKVEAEAVAAEKMGNPALDDIFKYIYDEMTPQQKEELAYLKQFKGKYY